MIEVLFILFSMIVLLALKGFFSGSEIALVNADKVKLNAMANQGDRGASLVLRQLSSPEVLLGTTLIGNHDRIVFGHDIHRAVPPVPKFGKSMEQNYHRALAFTGYVQIDFSRIYRVKFNICLRTPLTPIFWRRDWWSL